MGFPVWTAYICMESVFGNYFCIKSACDSDNGNPRSKDFRNFQKIYLIFPCLCRLYVCFLPQIIRNFEIRLEKDYILYDLRVILRKHPVTVQELCIKGVAVSCSC